MPTTARFRLTKSRVLLIVVILAGLGGLGVTFVRAARTANLYRQWADGYAVQAEHHRNRVAGFHHSLELQQSALDRDRQNALTEADESLVTRREQVVEYLRDLERYEELLTRHFETLRFKYFQSAEYPWEPVAPDPPLPLPPAQD